jgi:endonuclease/exonuclease/phosphatase family metal-dependent hydrolase
MSTESQFNRRRFLKGLGATLWAPWTAQCLGAQKLRGTGDGGTHMVVTANIRVALPADEATGHGWDKRRELCAAVIRAQRPDIICLQEVLLNQFEDLQAAWPEFAGLGFHGPEMDAHTSGYHGIAKNPIFYSRARYELVAAGGFWLSDTPHLPGSLSWGSARARHVNWVRLQSRDSGRQFRVLNTHLDHQSQPAREKQMDLILEESRLYPADFPQWMAGDLNADAANPVCLAIRLAGWTDSYAAVHGPDEPGFTAHAFLGSGYAARQRPGPVGKIDFIFVRGNTAVEDAAIIKDDRDGRYPSDHYFVSARLRLG